MAKAAVKDIDPIKAIIERILGETVPAEGQLKHPLEPKSRRGAYQHTAAELLAKSEKRSDFPDEIAEWTTRHFVDYTAKRIQEETGGNYKKLYRADIGYIQQIQRFMGSSGLAKNEWARNFIEWCLRRRAAISRKDGYFTIQVIPRYLNQFLQEEVLPKVEQGDVSRDHHDTSLLDEIRQADSEGQATEIIVRFGLPVATTYFVMTKGFKEASLRAAFRDRCAKMLSGGAEGREQLSRVFQSSVLGSPYPEGFLLTDWRGEYAGLLEPFEGDAWYRAEDYKGRPLAKYAAVLGGGDNAKNVKEAGTAE